MFKIIKEDNENKFGALIKGNDNKLYYRGALRGYAYEDGSWFTIANFKSSNREHTFKVFIYNSEGNLLREHELDGTEYDAEEWVEEVINMGYNSATEIEDEF